MNALNMISLTVALGPLRQLAAVYGLAPDEGRMLHHALGECFGRGTVQPFRLLPGRNGGRHSTLYGYTRSTMEQLRDIAATVAPPELAGLFDLAGLALKSMPESWPPGRRLAFDVRCIPVRRLLRPLPPWPGPEGAAALPKGAEVDVYLVDAMRRHPEGLPEGVDRLRLREELYLAWLAQRLGSCVTLHGEATRLVGVRRVELRRGSARKIASEAIFHGELTLIEPEAFSGLLTRGVGRHAAYGFGMLLLRPARG